MKRILFTTLAVTIGLAAGLVLTGRLHTAQSSDAAGTAPATGAAGLEAAPQAWPQPVERSPEMPEPPYGGD